MSRKYPEYILRSLRLRNELEAEDKSMDGNFNSYIKDYVFSEVLAWEGFVGYDGLIKSWIKGIYGIDLNDKDWNK